MRQFRLDTKYTPLLNKLGDYRQRRGWTVGKAAERLGEARGTYAALESGHALPSKQVLDRLCKLYKCMSVELYDPWLVLQIEAWAEMIRVRLTELEELETEGEADESRVTS